MLDYGLDGPGLILGEGGWRFSSLVRVQAGPGVHSAFHRMSTGTFLGAKMVGHRATHPISSSALPVNVWTLHAHPLWAFMACSGDTFTLYYLL